MLRSLSIESFRGIRRGELADLPRLALLTGPNGSGKSTVLEAIQVAAGTWPAESIGRVVRRRAEVANGPRWLLHRGDLQSRPKLTAQWADGSIRHTKLWVNGLQVGAKVRLGDGAEQGTTTLFRWQQGHHEYDAPENIEAARRAPFLRFLDQRIGSARSSLNAVYSESVLRSPVAFLEVLQRLDPGIRDLRILEEEGWPSQLHLIYDDRSVPVGLAGDGVESLVRLALELTVRDGGTFLVEEPEAHQHLAAVCGTARVLVAAARSNCQLIVTTHSLDLLDAILFELTPAERSLLAVYRTRLQQGELHVRRVGGDDVTTARTEIGEDLR